MQSATGEDRGRWWNRGRGGSPTLRCYQEQEGEEQEEDQEEEEEEEEELEEKEEEEEEEMEYEKEEKELEEKEEEENMVSHIKMLSGVHCPPAVGGKEGREQNKTSQELLWSFQNPRFTS